MFARLLIALVGVGALMVIHEGGHYFAARRFGMRVVKFSIGFGPALWRHTPKGSPTTFQVALIPFLAYVQIAGMNPYEESDPKDTQSYANASLWARVVTIAAGPLANYVFASILFFAALMAGGNYVQDETSMRIHVQPEGPAAIAGLRDGDRILSVSGSHVRDWDSLRLAVGAHPGEAIDIEVERAGQSAPLHVITTPHREGPFKGKILIGPEGRYAPVSIQQALWLSIKRPPLVVADTVRGVVRVLTLQESPKIAGPVGIVRDVADAAKEGFSSYLMLLGALSAYLGGFNLLPIPALDGGRLLFLGYEAVARRKSDAKVEAKVHALGLLMFLTLLAVVTYTEIMPTRTAPTDQQNSPK